MQITPYLSFNGNCAEAFRFYERCLGGRIEMMHTYGESPMKDQTPPGWENRVMHVHLDVKGQPLFGSDAPPEHFSPAQGMHVSIGLSSFADGERIFRELSEGGMVTMPFEKTFWAPGFGMCVDRFGTPWMVNVEHKG
jgi:PhnB protein